MSRKKALGKKIAHTLMAMSIVYSSGINIVVNQVYAGEKTENITGSSASFTETGANGIIMLCLVVLQTAKTPVLQVR